MGQANNQSDAQLGGRAISRGEARQALPDRSATPGAGQADQPTATGMPDAAGGWDFHRGFLLKDPTLPMARREALEVLGEGPFRPGQVLRAFRAGRTVAEVDEALTTLMSRAYARRFIAAAKAVLEREARAATFKRTNHQ